jgi:protein arginine kinase
MPDPYRKAQSPKERILNLNDMIKEIGAWLKGTGTNGDIVISSRVRLARNLSNFPFPHRASAEHREKVAAAILHAVTDCRAFANPLVLGIEEITPLDKQFLAERHIISPEFAQCGKSAKVIIGEKEIISLMVNEEDHLRLQAIQSGLQLMDAWKLVDEVDTQLSRRVRFAYSQNWGYLTTCPTNTGTGMRASLMLHLPCLVISKQIDKILQVITKFGLVARGLYGEGTEPSGDFFQISNQITLGRSEEDLIDNIERIGRQVVGHEQKARKLLLTKGRTELEDRVFRAYGILRNARIVSSAETLDLLSNLRLGTELGMIPNVDRKLLNELLMLVQPAHLQKMEGSKLSPGERDIKRADLIRRKLG